MDKKIKFVIKESSGSVNDNTIDIEMPDEDGKLRSVKVDAEPMMDFLVTEILNK